MNVMTLPSPVRYHISLTKDPRTSPSFRGGSVYRRKSRTDKTLFVLLCVSYFYRTPSNSIVIVQTMNVVKACDEATLHVESFFSFQISHFSCIATLPQNPPIKTERIQIGKKSCLSLSPTTTYSMKSKR